ncbi:DUF6252 family protein [Flavobacterium sp.]|uniref:DUF6252 family protein n=1 Tax=Flavobacterium sp. TaxID=239 RepID=UPI002637D098|nr:DUF6252 family protein [Flavobacterium sp.]
MKHLKFIYVFFLFSIAFLNSCSGDDEPIDPALLTPQPVGCAKPSFFNVSNFINGNTVRIDWDKTSADAWEVQYGTRGFAPGSGTTVVFTPTSSLISGLVSTTNYDFYIRSRCSDTNFSGWVGPVSPGSSIAVCVDPTNVSAIRMVTDPTKATVTWSANGDENSWQVQYGPSGFVIGSGTILASSTVTKEISSLVATTGYDVYVRSNCSANQNSDWVGPVVISPVGVVIGSCNTPTNLSAVRSQSTQALLTWNAGGTETSWEIQYGNVGFTVGAGTSVTSTATTKTITGLATTSYDFYVRAKCSATQNSAWFGPINMAAESSSGTYYLRMKVNGVLVNFPTTNVTASYNALDFMVMALIVSPTDNTSFQMQIADPQGMGTYTYADPNVDAFCVYIENNLASFSSSYDDLTESPGAIIITQLDTANRTIKGTFSFIGKDDTMTQSRTITEGEFYLPY